MKPYSAKTAIYVVFIIQHQNPQSRAFSFSMQYMESIEAITFVLSKLEKSRTHRFCKYISDIFENA